MRKYTICKILSYLGSVSGGAFFFSAIMAEIEDVVLENWWVLLLVYLLCSGMACGIFDLIMKDIEQLKKRRPR